MKRVKTGLCSLLVLWGLGWSGVSTARGEDLTLESTELRADQIMYGEWLPLRMQPTKSPQTSQHSVHLSPYNALQANRILDGLRNKKPMLLVRSSFGRLVIGNEDGLIQGMRPHILSASYQGSYLREYAAGWNPEGTLAIIERSADKMLLIWKAGDASRSITIYSDGLVETSWRNGPRNLEIFTGCHPYHFISADGKTAVRFSQLLQRRRALEGQSRFALFGYRDASLEIKASGLQSLGEEIWLDSGEVGWEWAVAYGKEHPKERAQVHVPFGAFMRKNAALTYLAGGAVRRMDFAAEGNQYELDYRIGERSKSALADVGATKFTHEIKPSKEPGRVSVNAPELWVWRIWPNDFHGWELRPLKRVYINPMPAFYEIMLRNDSGTERSFTFQVDQAAWMESAMLESDKQWLKTPAGKAPKYRQQSFWTGEGKPKVIVPAGKSKVVLLRLKPLEHTLGRCEFLLTWSSGPETGSLPLKLTVVPNIIVDPWGEPGLVPEDYQYFGCTGYLQTAAAGEREDEYLALRGQEILRNGKWGWIWVGGVKGFIRRVHEQNLQGAAYVRAAHEFVTGPRKTNKISRAAQAPYRYRLQMADEIWEFIGGYKGRRWMPVEDVAQFVYEMIFDSANPCQFSFMQGAIDDQYHVRIPNDIAELFYYCGRDEALHKYVEKLVKPRTELFNKWCKDPELIKRAGTDRPRQIMSFWISGQLHVTDYEVMRRQHWYTRYHGVDEIRFWVFRETGMLYANSIGCNSLMAVGRNAVLMTDRSLAWHDLREDMALITLVRLLKEKADRTIVAKVETLEQEAYAASQRNEFDLARHYLVSAVEKMEPKFVELVCSDFYQAVTAKKLPNLFGQDQHAAKMEAKKNITVHKLKGGHRPPPVLDGKLDNSYLQEGATLSDFRILNSFGVPEERTTAYLAWDEQKLYVLFVCNESLIDKLVADRNLPRDKDTWQTDCVELFVDRKRDGFSYTQFIVGAGGTRYDARNILETGNAAPKVVAEVETWDPDWQFVVARKEKAWAVEMIIPMSVLGGPPKPGEVWGMDFGRERQPKREFSIWCPTRGSFNDPRQFGEVTFQD